MRDRIRTEMSHVSPVVAICGHFRSRAPPAPRTSKIPVVAKERSNMHESLAILRQDADPLSGRQGGINGEVIPMRLPPDWMSGGHINEVKFCEEFLRDNPMICVRKDLFTVDGRVNEDELRSTIYEKIKDHVFTGVAKKVSNLIQVLHMECGQGTLSLDEDRIHVANGTLYLDGRFTGKKEYCINRLPVAYDPKVPYPWKWHNFLHELLEAEDVLTLQEYMGYCLIPTNRAQKMLIITGKGGEGKSRIGMVRQKLFGRNMKNGNLAKVEQNSFARADLENMLLMVDDDMKMEALRSTNYIKSIVTAETPMDLEKKGVQSYQGNLRVRFIAFGNGSLHALNDNSYAFFRRQINLLAKQRQAGRIDDPYLADKLCSEIEGILYWAFEGLQRLARNKFTITLSEETRARMEEAEAESNNILDFMKSEGYFLHDRDSAVSSKDFYEIYRLWCEDNAVNCLSTKTFSSFLKQNLKEYELKYSNKIQIADGKLVRGFCGIQLLQKPKL